MNPAALAGAAALSLGGGAVVDLWDARCAHLEQLLADLATLRLEETLAFGEAFVATDGPIGTKEQVARIAAASEHLAAELAAAKVAAYQIRIKAWLGEAANGTP